MNSRERVRRAIHFGTPDRPPISHAVLPAALINYGPALDEILEEFGDDWGAQSTLLVRPALWRRLFKPR